VWRKTLKSTVKTILFFAGLIMVLYSHNQGYVLANTLPPIPSSITGELEIAPGDTAVEKFNNLVQRIIIPNVKHGFVAISILILLYYVFQFIIATGTEDVDKQKGNLLWAAVGFGLIGISFKIVEIIAPGESRNVQTIGDIEESRATIRYIIIFIQYLAGAAALLFMVIAGIRIIISQGIEDEINKQKTNFTWGVIGLMTIMLSRAMVEVVYRVEGESVSAGDLGGRGSAEIIGIITYLLQFLGIAALCSLVIAGGYYITALGDEEQMNRAKRIILYTVVAIVIIFTSYSIVAYIFRPVAGQLQ
jgi:hypothetical protein